MLKPGDAEIIHWLLQGYLGLAAIGAIFVFGTGMWLSLKFIYRFLTRR